MKTRNELVEDFNYIPHNAPTEPALATGGAALISTSVLYIAHYFFPNVPDNVWNATFTIIAVVGPILVSLIIRQKVWSPDSVKRLANELTANKK